MPWTTTRCIEQNQSRTRGRPSAVAHERPISAARGHALTLQGRFAALFAMRKLAMSFRGIFFGAGWPASHPARPAHSDRRFVGATKTAEEPVNGSVST